MNLVWCRQTPSCLPSVRQYNGMAMYYRAVQLVQRSCLCRSFVITKLVSPSDDESARALGVLDVDEYSLKERFNVKYSSTHTRYHICVLPMV